MYAAGNAAAKMVGTAVAPLAGAIGPAETIASKAITVAKPALEDFRAGYYGDPAPVRPDPSIPTIATVTPKTAANADALNPPRPSFSGVTGSADTTSGTPALSDSGRPLGYGSAINGVRVFSDGSGGPGAPPATMTKGQIDALGNGNRLSIANSGVGGNIDSEALGGTRPTASGSFGSTPELGSPEGYALSRPSPSVDRSAAILAKADRDADYAKSDLASIMGRDPRSPLGTIARNMDVDIDSAGLGGKDAAALKAAANRAQQQGLLDIEGGRASANQDALRDAGATARTGTEAARDITRAQIEKQQPGQHITLADGTLGIVGSDGVVRPATDPTGSPVHLQIGKPAIDSAAYGKRLSENVSRILGLDPVTGLMPDPQNPGKFRQATPAELYRASTLGSKLTKHDFGLDEDPSMKKPVPDRKPDESPTYVDESGHLVKWIDGKVVPVSES
jgi:hypothetical protein